MISNHFLTAVLFFAIAASSKKFSHVPAYDEDRREKLLIFHNNMTKNIHSGCGIIWLLSSLNGSMTNYDLLHNVGGGEGLYRLKAVAHEVFTSAARFRNALISSSNFPDCCHGDRPELALFVDRDIFINLKENDITLLSNCLFDKIVFLDTIPFFDAILAQRHYRKKDMLIRLAPRPNAAKLLIFLLTPYKYTLYLDGDTAPCPNFQNFVFNILQENDVLTTSNPFGYEVRHYYELHDARLFIAHVFLQSTGGAKTYNSSPPHKNFAKFPEVNGGVFAYRYGKECYFLPYYLSYVIFNYQVE